MTLWISEYAILSSGDALLSSESLSAFDLARSKLPLASFANAHENTKLKVEQPLFC